MLLPTMLDMSCWLISVSTPASSSPLAVELCGLSRLFQAALPGVSRLLLRQTCLVSRCANCWRLLRSLSRRLRSCKEDAAVRCYCCCGQDCCAAILLVSSAADLIHPQTLTAYICCGFLHVLLAMDGVLQSNVRHRAYRYCHC